VGGGNGQEIWRNVRLFLLTSCLPFRPFSYSKNACLLSSSSQVYLLPGRQGSSLPQFVPSRERPHGEARRNLCVPPVSPHVSRYHVRRRPHAPDGAHGQVAQSAEDHAFDPERAAGRNEVRALPGTGGQAARVRLPEGAGKFNVANQAFANSVIMSVVFGRRASIDDPELKAILKAVADLGEYLFNPMKNLCDAFPWLAKLPKPLQWWRPAGEAYFKNAIS
jgi:hypothetical protein